MNAKQHIYCAESLFSTPSFSFSTPLFSVYCIASIPGKAAAWYTLHGQSYEEEDHVVSSKMFMATMAPHKQKQKSRDCLIMIKQS